MARRGKARTGRRPAQAQNHGNSHRPMRLGSHWRADGQPKTSYSSEGEAWVVADEQRRDSGIVLNVYPCNICSAWHMGRSSGREQ
jgi:hypothetical protein